MAAVRLTRACPPLGMKAFATITNVLSTYCVPDTECFMYFARFNPYNYSNKVDVIPIL